MRPTNHGLSPLFLIAAIAMSNPLTSQADQPTYQDALKLHQDGNFKEAYDVFKRIASNDGKVTEITNSINLGVQCLQQLNRTDETDSFRELAYRKHKDNWRIVRAVAQSYLNANHGGYIIAGEFSRGHHRGGGRWVNSMRRDRARALQLYVEAMSLAKDDTDKRSVAQLYFDIAGALNLNYWHGNGWQLQALTDLTELPDYEEENYGRHQISGAPVDAEGNPIFYSMPQSWETANSDGERWIWALDQASRIDPKREPDSLSHIAHFAMSQFGVQTMQNFYWWPRHAEDTDTEASVLAVHTLEDDETLAKLANGIRRFRLPEQYNFVSIFRELAEGDSSQAAGARWQLANIYLNRRQYAQAAEEFRTGAKQHRRSYNWKQQIEQIEGNWCRFETVTMQAAGKGATIEFRFRNATNVSFTAHRIDLQGLLAEMKQQLKRRPKDVDWRFFDPNSLGYQIVQKELKRFVTEQVASWQQKLQPAKNHFDRRVTITTPLQDAGAYLLTAKMPDGNTSKVVVWLADMAITTKNLGDKTMYVVTDAESGQPIQAANVEFLGYRRQERRIETRNFAENTDTDGFAFLSPEDDRNRYQWIAIARKDDRLAFLGFSNIWRGSYTNQRWNQTRAFAVTDRPVYRPDQEVQFKLWLRQVSYERDDDTSQFAGETVTIQILNPKQEKVFEQKIKADELGGVEGVFELPPDATLGLYTLTIQNWSRHNLQAPPDNPFDGYSQQGGTFRVEEYKKPEFEVTVDAPDAPISLGESFTAKVKAKYYFGSPVTNATVKYKVLRTRHDSAWFPPTPWDWLYGPGYWWFCYDYEWYPGWGTWGCRRPAPWWFWRAPEQPEVVATAEVPIGEDGTIDIKIDTTIAKELHGDQDHSYQIQAEVVDDSRRTIVANGRVLVARAPFKVNVWVDRGYYRAGDTIRASLAARTIDGKAVQGAGVLRLHRIAYTDGEPVETEVERWDLATSDEGTAQQQMIAAEPGQYRLSYTVTDANQHDIEGGYIFTVIGRGFDGSGFRFDHLEVIPDRREYKPGDKVTLQINTNRRDSYVLLFLRPSNGIYQAPRAIRLDGKSTTVDFDVTRADMPNCFVEAITVADGKLHTVTREIFLPPEKRVLEVAVEPSKTEYLPGDTAQLKVRLTDHEGEPYQGSTIVAVYDKSVEYISGGSNVPEIRAFFWKWRRQHRPQAQTNLGRAFANLVVDNRAMRNLGVFGDRIEERASGMGVGGGTALEGRAYKSQAFGAMRGARMAESAMPAADMALNGAAGEFDDDKMGPRDQLAQAGGDGDDLVDPEIRSEFADTALWVGSLTTDAEGYANVEFPMPENLTSWRIRVWGMGHGTRVGEGDAEVVTRKNLIVRLQAPRFFIDTDEVVLSANVHNYLDTAKEVTVRLEMEGGTIELQEDNAEQIVRIDADGEARVDWRVNIVGEGNATIRMLALTDEESDAMQMDFRVYVHGMLRQDPYSGSIRPEADNGSFTITVPADRRPEQTRLEVRYSPTLAAAMIDAIPYLIDYPYGCTEQTLNRFLPAVITRSVLANSGIDLEAIEKHRTNLNAQELGDDAKRKQRWKQYDRNPVFNSAEHLKIVKTGVERLTEMQLSDGGWGWFSGFRERSTPHTTAVVVHGLQIAESHDVALVPGVLDRGVQWLTNYQNQQVRYLDNVRNGKQIDKDLRAKYQADNLDALIFMVLTDAGVENTKMLDYLYRDRTKLAVYSLATYGLALHKLNEADKLAMVMRNIEQYVVQDDENQTAYLNLPGGYWWYWYGSEMEAHAYYLKLLVATNPQSAVAPRLVKYLLNNRRHATYWNSTRDTALVVEAFADYLSATDEMNPNMTVEVWLDGNKRQEVKITSENLFTFDNSFVIEGADLSAGQHTVELRKQGTGALYYNGYLENFTLEEFIKRAGLELRVQRKYYRLVEIDKTAQVAGSRGQVVDQKVEKYEREELANLAELTSGDLVEIELEIDSKNDYEYILFEDMKPAGFEPVELRSGYTDNEMRAYVEFRDNRVAMFVQRLARGKHSISYRMRAETPGKFSALPTRASAMYAPELKGNSDEIKLRVTDK